MKRNDTRSDASNERLEHAASNLQISMRAIFEQLYYNVEADPAGQLHALSRKGQSSDRRLFEAMEQLCFDAMFVGETIAGQMSADVLLNSICQYYETVGLFSHALNAGAQVLTYSISVKNLALQRRAHNCIGGSYIRFCDFGKACEHLEQACRVAIKINHPFFVFASLSNTVALFKSMGLLESAKKLALQLTRQPGDSSNYNHVHLVNANNGLSVCLALGDLDNARKFYQIGKEKINRCEDFLTEINVAYFESASIVLIAKQGNALQAVSRGEKYLNCLEECSAFRVKVLFSCALAEARLILNNKLAILDSCVLLEGLLKPAQDVPTHYEEILRLLVRLYTARFELGDEKNVEKVVNYLRRLREHLVGMKHRVFFEDQLKDLNAVVDESLVLMNPYYKLPGWLSYVQGEMTDLSVEDASEEYAQASEIDLIPCKIAKLAGSQQEVLFRSSEYDVAENWAVAADIALGSDGKHGFRVGRLASALALKLGFSMIDAVHLELASRLHNIGHITMLVRSEGTGDRRERGAFSYFCQHVNIGQQLLGRSHNVTFKLGSVIAGSHHEWWNGGGYPLGSKHETIPLVGRLCMLADTFIRLLKPEFGKEAFSLAQAQRQLVAMSGVQLDPNLVHLLIEFLDNNDDLGAAVDRSKARKLSSSHLFSGRDKINGVLELTA